MNDLTKTITRANAGDHQARRDVEIAMGQPEGYFARLIDSIQDTKKAAAEGSAADMAKLGQFYYTGIGMDKNVLLAEYWLGKAAMQNDPGAMYHLGQIYFAEYGDRLHEAKELIERAMELGPIPGVSSEEARASLATVKMMIDMDELIPKPANIIKSRMAVHDHVSEHPLRQENSNRANAEFIKQAKTRGAKLYEDKPTLLNLIADIFAENEIMRNTMRVVVEDGIPIKIVQLLNEDFSTRKIKLAQIIDSFAKRYGMDKQRAHEAVVNLAAGLGI